MIAVCSSKGGVGKTTLSCEIAEFLSMVWNGKKQMRVCLADLDIVCGDELARAAAACPRVRVVHVMSDDPEWEGGDRRIPQHR